MVTFLQLSGNNIGVDGAKAIAEALKVNAVLTKLGRLEYNIMGDEGPEWICVGAVDMCRK